MTIIQRFYEDLLLEALVPKEDWKLQNHMSTMAFKYPPKPDSLTAKFVDFVKKNPGTATKKTFYASIGRVYTSGHNSQFFAGIKDAGIVEFEKGKYKLGKSYELWTQDKLARPSNISNRYWKLKNTKTGYGLWGVRGKESDFRGNNLTSLHNIHEELKNFEGIASFVDNPIKSHVLGLLKIKGLIGVKLDNKKLQEIINRHLKGNRNVFDCQEELEDAGLGAFAQL